MLKGGLKMDTKKNFKETKFGQFLSKAGKSFPEILAVGGEILTGDFGGAVDKVGDILRGKSENNADALKLLQEFEMAKMDFQKDIYAIEVEDRKSARVREVDMAKIGKTDWLMYATGVTGLIAFFVIIYAAIWIPSSQNNKLFIHLMGMVEGTALTIFAYYFGSSKGSKDKDLRK